MRQASSSFCDANNHAAISCSSCCRKDCIIPKVGTHRSPEITAPINPTYVHLPKRKHHTVRAEFALQHLSLRRHPWQSKHLWDFNVLWQCQGIRMMENKKPIPVLYERKEDCCGCTACYAICPKGAISMKEDEEGFEYPVIQEDTCIRCSMCLKVCPIKEAKK